MTKPLTKPLYWDWDENRKHEFEVPFRCFLPKKINNLVLTGASLSFTYETIFMVMRNFPWCTQTGEIAGFVAGRCIERKINPKEYEYVEAVRRDPKLGSVGTSGLASVGAFMIVLLRKISGADIRLVAYRGGQPLLTDLIGNHVAAGQSVLSDYVEPHRAGQVKIIGVMSEKRTKLAPDISTFKEQGFTELHGQTSMGFFARGGTPREMVNRYAASITKVVAMPDVRARLEAIGIESTGSTPVEFAGAVKYQRARWEPVAREAGIKLN